MTRTSFRIRAAALALAVALVAVATARSDPPGPTASTQEVIQLLQRDIDLTKVPDRLKLKDVLELISDHLTKENRGKEVRILLDVNAFKAENEEITSDALLAEDIEIPAFPKKMSVARLLRLALDKLPTRNATYVVRRGGLEITTSSQASPTGQAEKVPAGRLGQRVVAAFSGVPLKQAVEELADQVGASVVLDPRAGEKVKLPVTATFRNDTTLGAALDMLADMCELKLVVLERRPPPRWPQQGDDPDTFVPEQGLYLTTPANAEAIHKEQARRRAAAIPRAPARPDTPTAQPQAHKSGQP